MYLLIMPNTRTKFRAGFSVNFKESLEVLLLKAGGAPIILFYFRNLRNHETGSWRPASASFYCSVFMTGKKEREEGDLDPQKTKLQSYSFAVCSGSGQVPHAGVGGDASGVFSVGIVVRAKSSPSTNCQVNLLLLTLDEP